MWEVHNETSRDFRITLFIWGASKTPKPVGAGGGEFTIILCKEYHEILKAAQKLILPTPTPTEGKG